jgi:hypothetical protein
LSLTFLRSVLDLNAHGGPSSTLDDFVVVLIVNHDRKRQREMVENDSTAVG